ncbi:MAG TPA: sugar ABC transporter permease [bacterium]|nr:sugar ABC transporter permease [bacterium]
MSILPLHHRTRKRLAPYLFLSPFLLCFAVFLVYPLVRSVWMAFTQCYGPKATVFVGLGNFEYLLRNPMFWRAVLNTTVFAVGAVSIQLPLALGLALILNRPKLPGRNTLRFAFFIPHLVGQVFIAVIFALLYTPRYGLFNQTLHFLFGAGLETRWLTDASLVMPALILTATWMYTGFVMIYFLAALQAVDPQLYEAAQVDGANAGRRFLHVTLPGIQPVTVFVLVTSTIGAFKLFELPYILLSRTGGPKDAGLTIVMYLFQTGFEAGDLGYASAIGWALVFFVLTISLIQIRMTRTFREE